MIMEMGVVFCLLFFIYLNLRLGMMTFSACRYDGLVICDSVSVLDELHPILFLTSGPVVGLCPEF